MTNRRVEALLIIFVFIILSTCVASDMGGFIVGKVFEGPKLTKISPNKTISGSIGSLLFSAILITTATYYFTNNLEIKFLMIGCVVSIGCQIGDLFFSLCFEQFLCEVNEKLFR